MNKRQVVRDVAQLVVEYGSGIIVHAFIKNNVSVTRIDKKIAVAVASFAIGNIVSKTATRSLDEFISNIFDTYDKIKKNA